MNRRFTMNGPSQSITIKTLYLPAVALLLCYRKLGFETNAKRLPDLVRVRSQNLPISPVHFDERVFKTGPEVHEMHQVRILRSPLLMEPSKCAGSRTNVKNKCPFPLKHKRTTSPLGLTH